MKPTRSLDICRTFIECQTMRPRDYASPPLPVVTISRATGARGITISDLLCEYLQTNEPEPTPPWTVFEKTLIDQVIADHELPASMAQFMPEDVRPLISNTVEELLGLHESPYDQVRQTVETIMRLGHMGRAIIVGRGAQMVLSEMPQALHVRLVGSRNRRAQHLSEYYNLKPAAALEMLEREDTAQRRYLRAHYHCDVDDPTLYHLVINTDKLTSEDAAMMIGDAVFRLGQRMEAAYQQTDTSAEGQETTYDEAVAEVLTPEEEHARALAEAEAYHPSPLSTEEPDESTPQQA